MFLFDGVVFLLGTAIAAFPLLFYLKFCGKIREDVLVPLNFLIKYNSQYFHIKGPFIINLFFFTYTPIIF